MYSLDINFLNDRDERVTDAGPAVKRGGASTSKTPFFIGLGVALLLPMAAAGLWLFALWQESAVQQEIADLDQSLQDLQADLNEVELLNAQIAQIQQQNQALATVFDEIKPWSAILQDVRGRVPAGVQIASVTQIEQPPPPPPPPAAAADPTAPPPVPPEPPPAQVQIVGQAQTFSDVNDFVLTLQQSPFLMPEETRLVTANLVANPASVEIIAPEDVDVEIEVQLPQVVEYTIQSTLVDLPTSELLPDLERNLALGLAARIQALRDRGVVQP
jgi:type IV pilus assembly protein PilN